MSELDGFKIFDFEEGVASVSITPNGVTFNKGVVMKLGYPEHVLLLLNTSGKQMALKACEESTLKSVPFYKEQEGKESVRSVRWNNRDLLNSLSSMMDWDLSVMAHRVDGRLLSDERAIIFDLVKAKDLK